MRKKKICMLTVLVNGEVMLNHITDRQHLEVSESFSGLKESCVILEPLSCPVSYTLKTLHFKAWRRLEFDL